VRWQSRSLGLDLRERGGERGVGQWLAGADGLRQEGARLGLELFVHAGIAPAVPASFCGHRGYTRF
jgi:hypothetical protein